MEATIVYCGYIGIMKKSMATYILLGLYWGIRVEGCNVGA